MRLPGISRSSSEVELGSHGAQAGHAHVCDEHGVGHMLEHDQRVLAETRRGVDDDVAERPTQSVD